MALLSDLFGVTGQPLPQTIESPTDELMRRALELNKNAAQPQGITISRPDMPDMVQRALGGGEQIPTAAPISPAPAPAPQPQAISRPVALPPLNQAAASAVPQREPTFMDRMAAFASGYQGGGLIGAIANASQGPDKAVQLENQTAQLLAGRLGVTPTEALALAKRPDIMQQLLPVLTQRGRKTAVINGRLVDEQSGQLIADFSDTNRQGPEIKTLETPDGDKINVFWDAPNKRWATLDASSGGAVPSNVAGGPTQVASTGPGVPITTGTVPPALPPGVNRRILREKMSGEIGEGIGKGRTALPGVLRAADQIIKSVEAVEQHPSLSRVTGPLDAYTPTIFGQSKDVQARIQELQGQTFLQAYETLKGAGAVNVEEGKRATDALNRLQRTDVNDASYKVALAEFKDTVRGMVDTAKVKAGEMPEQHAGARRDAREAIKKGAPAAAVKQRLMQNGIDPEGL
jgi:hypothetical protein